ncbi:MAG: hypothetical protein R3231_02645 [bacterium]|nr:hypothetical protein [bacterium]
MIKIGLYVLAGIITIALTTPPAQANNLEVLLHSAKNQTSQAARPSKDARPQKQINEAVTNVVVSEMTLLRSFFLMFSPDPKDAEPEAPVAATSP